MLEAHPPAPNKNPLSESQLAGRGQGFNRVGKDVCNQDSRQMTSMSDLAEPARGHRGMTNDKLE